MALVVADTSPLRFLVEIGCEHVLPALYREIWIPGAVAGELQHQRTPALVRQWAAQMPPWVRVRVVSTPGFDPDAAEIDQGEWEAITLAKEIQANLLLVDDRAGVQAARRLGFTVTGTLGVLVEAAANRLIEIEEALEKLGQTKFRRTPDLFTKTIELARERRGRKP